MKEVLDKSVYLFDILQHAKGSLEVTNVVRMNPWVDPTPSTPWVRPHPEFCSRARMLTALLQGTFLSMGQDSAERILRSHLARYGCEVELGTSLSAFKQDKDHVTGTLVKSVDGEDHIEEFEVDWLIGADGARGKAIFSENRCPLLTPKTQGVTRKALGLTFLGESRQNENLVIVDLQIKGLSTAVSLST